MSERGPRPWYTCLGQGRRAPPFERERWHDEKFLLVLAAAVLAAAAFFLYSLATVELPEMEGGASSQAYGDVAPIQGRPESASSAPAEPAADLSFLNEEQQNVFARAQETVPWLADPST